MSTLVSAIRPGAYRDSIVLMQLQAALSELPGVEDAGAVMATPENLELLAASGLLPDPAPTAGPPDLCVVVRAESEEVGRQALERIDALLRRDSSGAEGSFRPHTLAGAAKLAPGARFALISVPGRYAAAVAGQALELDLHVFLYSDNVEVDEEIRLKQDARDAGLLVMGPDCGTALIGGVGLGFANHVRRGHIGIVAASGTGLQAVASAIHELGRGVSQGIGTGGRDLSRRVDAITAIQAVGLLSRDPETRVIVLISKPPSPEVAQRLLSAAASSRKPIVVAFQGNFAQPPSGASADAGGTAAPEAEAGRETTLHFASDLSEAARLAVRLDEGTMGVRAGHGGEADDVSALRQGRDSHRNGVPTPDEAAPEAGRAVPGAGKAAAGAGTVAPYLRGLFSGGTLALEALLKLRGRVYPLFSNLGSGDSMELDDPAVARGHAVIDLGADEFTVGRPHPMIDNELRLRRLRQEIEDPETGVVMLDVVLGYGAHSDPASELASVIAEARRPDLAIIAIVIGTEGDPQAIHTQIEWLESAGAHVHRDVEGAVSHALALLGEDSRPAGLEAGPAGSAPASSEAFAAAIPPEPEGTPVALDDFTPPISAINVGLERFAESLAAQDVEVVQVDWRPPAGGDARLLEILERLRR